MQPSPAIVVTADHRLIHLSQASAAVSGATISVVSQIEDLRSRWRTASAILIGSDLIEKVVSWSLPKRGGIFLIGESHSYEVLCRWSVPLGASVIHLPDGAKWLSRVIGGYAKDVRSAKVVAVRSGAGGVGASTLTMGLALAAIRASRSVALVDADPLGGGLDLLLGAENTPGWRWDKLRSAVGQIADITPMLPKAEGITVVSMERGTPTPVPDAALESVVDCLARSHDLVVIDPGRVTRGFPMVQRNVIISSQAVRSLAATRDLLGSMNLPQSALVIRKGGSVGANDAAQALEIPIIAVIPHLPELARLADRGVAPWLGGGWKKACGKVLHWCLNDEGDTDG